MTRLPISVIAALATLLLAIPQPAQAQNDAGELSAGWQLLHFEEETFSRGWYADVLGNLTDSLGVVGEVSGHYRTIDETRLDAGVAVNVSAYLRIHTFMGGIRAGSQGPVRGFGQFLVGGVRLGASDATDSASETNVAIQLGGGVNVTGKPDPAVAVTVKSGSPKVLAASGLKVIV